MEKKEVSQSGVEAKPEIKAAAGQQPYTKEFKDQLVEIYNSGIYESAAECARNYQVPERLLYQWISANKNSLSQIDQSFELTKLKKENSQLKMELELLKKSNGVFCQTNEVKYTLILENEDWLTIGCACKLFGVSRSGYYYWKANTDKRLIEELGAEQLLAVINAEFNKSRELTVVLKSPKVCSKKISKLVIIRRLK